MTDRSSETGAASKRQRTAEAVDELNRMDQLSSALRHLLLKFVPYYDEAKGRRVNKLADTVSKSNTDIKRVAQIADLKEHEALLTEFLSLLSFQELSVVASGRLAIPWDWKTNSPDGYERAIRSRLRDLEEKKPGSFKEHLSIMTTSAVESDVLPHMTKPELIDYLHKQVGGTKKALNVTPDELRQRILARLDTTAKRVEFLKVWKPVVKAALDRKVTKRIAGRSKASATKERKKENLAKDMRAIDKVVTAVKVGLEFEAELIENGYGPGDERTQSRSRLSVRVVAIRGRGTLERTIVVRERDSKREWELKGAASEDGYGDPSWRSGGNPFVIISSKNLRSAADRAEYSKFRAGIAGAGSGSGSGSAGSAAAAVDSDDEPLGLPGSGFGSSAGARQRGNDSDDEPLGLPGSGSAKAKRQA